MGSRTGVDFARRPAEAQNSEDVVAGSDVALTGGAVVANAHTVEQNIVPVRINEIGINLAVKAAF